MKIFISYAHHDSSTAIAVRQALDIHDVWFDQRLHVGAAWWDEIERQIASSNCILFLLSPKSVESEFCQKELDVAIRLSKPIAPVMIQKMDIPENLSSYQIISLTEGLTSESTPRLLNGLFEIERQVFNPLKVNRGVQIYSESPKLAISDLYFATSNTYKQQEYEQILNVKLQTSPAQLADIQHVEVGEVALHKVRQAFEILQKPVFVEHSGLSIRVWGGLPGGVTTTFLPPLGLYNLCKMLQPFDDRYAQAISVIAFTDGMLMRKFVGMTEGEIADKPRGAGYSWNNIFVPEGFTKTLGEMSEDEVVSISSRRRAMIDFMRFLQSNYELE